MNRVTEWTDYIILESVFAFNRAKINAFIGFKRLRHEILPLHIICVGVEFVVGVCRNILNKLTHLRTVPKCDSWISLYECDFAEVQDYQQIDDPLNVYYQTAPLKRSAQTNETYNLFEPPFVSFTDFQTAFANKYRKFCDIHKDSPSGKLIIAQAFPDIMRIKRVESARPDKDVESIVRSDVSFFSVNYSAKPNGFAVAAHYVTIEIPKSHYAVGNELLSMEYVSRYLEYLPIYQQSGFNGTYNLQIIDEDMNFLNLNETQWILLTDSGYEIMDQTKNVHPVDNETPTPTPTPTKID